MKKIITLLTGLALSVGISLSAVAEIQSLRGSLSLDSDSQSFEKRKQIKQKDGFERSYKIQPPMIPHATDKDRITLKGNTCMKCHSEKNHKKEKAPRIGGTETRAVHMAIPALGPSLGVAPSGTWIWTSCCSW